MTQLPSIRSYADNHAANAMRVTVGELDLYFSYETVIAFAAPATGLVVSENIYSKTTGKHINLVSRGAPRFPRAEFEAQLAAVVASLD